MLKKYYIRSGKNKRILLAIDEMDAAEKFLRLIRHKNDGTVYLGQFIQVSEIGYLQMHFEDVVIPAEEVICKVLSRS